MSKLPRLLRILYIGLRFRLYRLAPRFADDRDGADAAHLREALETLGPIFVKFGQVLSTRRDLLPVDVADELAKLQDRVPPFSFELAAAGIESSLGKPLETLFEKFDEKPIASASVAQ